MKQPCQVWIYIFFLLCRSAQLLLHATWQNMIMPIARMVVAPARCWCLVLQLPSLRADVLPPPGPPIVAWTCAFAAFHMPIQFVIHFFFVCMAHCCIDEASISSTTTTSQHCGYFMCFNVTGKWQFNCSDRQITAKGMESLPQWPQPIELNYEVEMATSPFNK